MNATGHDLHGKWRKIAILVGGTILAMAVNSNAAEVRRIQAEACEALKSADFSGIQDAPARVLEIEVTEAAGELPAYCLVQGSIWPHVGFLMKLPLYAWNGKFSEAGLGGLGGPLLAPYCDDPLRRGYACITMDTGHRGDERDGLWAYNNLQAEIDYGFRAVHVAALAGKAIIEHYYGRPPEYSYFIGCSGGGRQALVEAQLFPWDFDGIIAMDPAVNLTEVLAILNWNAQAVTGEDGRPLFTPADLELLHQAAVGECDMDDGVKDGVIGYPPACRFDPAELACMPRQKSGCLSEDQVAAARKVYRGPVNSAGERLFVGRTIRGAETGYLGFGIGMTPAIRLAIDFFQYMAFVPDPGPTWQYRDFDFDRDHKRLRMMQALYADGNPDLRRFQAAGGKLMITQGWDDSGTPFPLNTIDYYEAVERVMGGREATQQFARLYMMPGRAHCAGGPGAQAFDFLGYLEAWVEDGRAPDVLIGAHIDNDDEEGLDPFVRHNRFPEDPARIKFTRPVYPYPLRAVYQGTGDPNDHRNWEPSVAPVEWDKLP